MNQKPFPVRLDPELLAKVAAVSRYIKKNKSETMRRALRVGLAQLRPDRLKD